MFNNDATHSNKHKKYYHDYSNYVNDFWEFFFLSNNIIL